MWASQDCYKHDHIFGPVVADSTRVRVRAYDQEMCVILFRQCRSQTAAH